jgi:hypothetical protein
MNTRVALHGLDLQLRGLEVPLRVVEHAHVDVRQLGELAVVLLLELGQRSFRYRDRRLVSLGLLGQEVGRADLPRTPVLAVRVEIGLRQPGGTLLGAAGLPVSIGDAECRNDFPLPPAVGVENARSDDLDIGIAAQAVDLCRLVAGQLGVEIMRLQQLGEAAIRQNPVRQRRDVLVDVPLAAR